MKTYLGVLYARTDGALRGVLCHVHYHERFRGRNQVLLELERIAARHRCAKAILKRRFYRSWGRKKEPEYFGGGVMLAALVGSGIGLIGIVYLIIWVAT